MTTLVEQAMTALQSLPADRRDELAQTVIDMAMPTIQYSDQQIAGIEDALSSARAGDYADQETVEATFTKFRGV